MCMPNKVGLSYNLVTVRSGAHLRNTAGSTNAKVAQIGGMYRVDDEIIPRRCHSSCRDGIQPWQLVPQGHHAAERVTSAFLLSCK